MSFTLGTYIPVMPGVLVALWTVVYAGAATVGGAGYGALEDQVSLSMRRILAAQLPGESGPNAGSTIARINRYMAEFQGGYGAGALSSYECGSGYASGKGLFAVAAFLFHCFQRPGPIRLSILGDFQRSTEQQHPSDQANTRWLSLDDDRCRYRTIRWRTFSRFQLIRYAGAPWRSLLVCALLEDKQGSLWAGTSDSGAVIYRDENFRTLTTKDGLASNRVFRIDEGPDGKIWIFTDRGLSYWENGRLLQVAQGPGSLGEGELADPSNYFGRDGHFWGKWRRDTSGWQRFAYGEWSRFSTAPSSHQTGRSQN